MMRIAIYICLALLAVIVNPVVAGNDFKSMTGTWLIEPDYYDELFSQFPGLEGISWPILVIETDGTFRLYRKGMFSCNPLNEKGEVPRSFATRTLECLRQFQDGEKHSLGTAMVVSTGSIIATTENLFLFKQTWERIAPNPFAEDMKAVQQSFFTRRWIGAEFPLILEQQHNSLVFTKEGQTILRYRQISGEALSGAINITGRSALEITTNKMGNTSLSVPSELMANSRCLMQALERESAAKIHELTTLAHMYREAESLERRLDAQREAEFEAHQPDGTGPMKAQLTELMIKASSFLADSNFARAAKTGALRVYLGCPEK